MIRRAARRAFTLLEAVLALTLALSLVLVMLTFYKQATDVRAAVLDEALLVGEERAVMDLATQELRAAMAAPQAGIGVEGAIDQIRFATVALPGGSVWIVRRAAESDQLPPERDLQIVGYRLRIVEDDMGQPVVVGLERTCQRLLTAQVAEEGVEIQATLVSAGLKFLRLRYWDGTTWLESWGGNDLPQAVEICLGREPLPEGVEPLQYPYPLFRRVVFVPAGARAASGTVVRGLGEETGP